MDTRKIICALAIIAEAQEDKSVENIKAYKLLWLADRLHLRRFGRTITGDVYYAMPKGPVPSDAKNILENERTRLRTDKECVKQMFALGIGTYTLIGVPNRVVMSKTDEQALDDVLKTYNMLDADQLVSLTHDYPEWKAYEDKLNDRKEPDSHRMDMRLMFNDYDDGYALFEESIERLTLTKQIFESHYGFKR